MAAFWSDETSVKPPVVEVWVRAPETGLLQAGACPGQIPLLDFAIKGSLGNSLPAGVLLPPIFARAFLFPPVAQGIKIPLIDAL